MVGQQNTFNVKSCINTSSFTGVDAVEKVAPELLYLDISLVGQDGREVAQELKGDESTKHIPIVILTAYPNADELAKEAGGDGHLSKPFELAELWKMTAKYTPTSEKELHRPVSLIKVRQ